MISQDEQELLLETTAMSARFAGRVTAFLNADSNLDKQDSYVKGYEEGRLDLLAYFENKIG